MYSEDESIKLSITDAGVYVAVQRDGRWAVVAGAPDLQEAIEYAINEHGATFDLEAI
jgi:hypothetical protein